MRTVYALTKKLSNEETHKNSPAIEDKNGNLINGRVETLERWNEHFKEILNRKDPEKPIIDAETEATVIEEINIQEPTNEEIKRAIKHLKMGSLQELTQ